MNKPEEMDSAALTDEVLTASGEAPHPEAEEPRLEESQEPQVEMDAADLLGSEAPSEQPAQSQEEAALKSLIEAVIYITEEPLTIDLIAGVLERPKEMVAKVLQELNAEYARPDRGLAIREVAGGFKMGTKPEHHEQLRTFVKKLKPPLKLSLAALETLAVIAYKQPITGPEIQEIRGVQGSGVLKTLVDRKLITSAGRKNVVGKPMLYKTTKDFLLQFGLKDLAELPTLKEFEELRRFAFPDDALEPPAAAAPPVAAAEPVAEAPAEPGIEPLPPAAEPASEPEAEQSVTPVDEDAASA